MTIEQLLTTLESRDLFAEAEFIRTHLSQPAQAVDVGAISLDGTDNEVLSEFIRLCREAKPVGRWPGERVCVAIERLMANQKPFRFIAESDKAPERGHNGRGGDGDRVFSGPQPTTRALSAEKAGWRVPDENWLADQLCDLRNRWGEHEPGWLETDDNHPDDWMAKELRKRLLDLPASPTTAKEG